MYDIAGGAMWANKSDNILSYYRPNHHIDKTSPEVIVYIQKIKRRRTGGKPGEVHMKMLWSIKRFVDSQGEFPFLNPQNKNKPQYSNQELRLPYSDKDLDLLEEAPF
jgi:hypothetical protein